MVTIHFDPTACTMTTPKGEVICITHDVLDTLTLIVREVGKKNIQPVNTENSSVVALASLRKTMRNVASISNALTRAKQLESEAIERWLLSSEEA